MIPKSFLEDVQDKKEFRGLSEKFIKKIALDILEDETNLADILYEKDWNDRSKEYKEFKKLVRKHLRRIHGVFYKDKSKGLTDWHVLLKRHRSTSERYQHFTEVYQWIEELGMTTLMDLGCGYNPFSYTLFENIQKFYCVDINKEDKAIVNEFLNDNSLQGSYEVKDLTKKENYDHIIELSKDYDIVLMLKLLDSLETLKKDISYSLLKDLKSKYLVVSFPLKSISGKEDFTTKRTWFKQAIKESNYTIKEIKEFGPEKYYLLKRNEI